MPADGAEMNAIAGAWRYLKRDELRGALFERTAALADPVISGLERRSEIQAGEMHIQMSGLFQLLHMSLHDSGVCAGLILIAVR